MLLAMMLKMKYKLLQKKKKIQQRKMEARDAGQSRQRQFAVTVSEPLLRDSVVSINTRTRRNRTLLRDDELALSQKCDPDMRAFSHVNLERDSIDNEAHGTHGDFLNGEKSKILRQALNHKDRRRSKSAIVLKSEGKKSILQGLARNIISNSTRQHDFRQSRIKSDTTSRQTWQEEFYDSQRQDAYGTQSTSTKRKSRKKRTSLVSSLGL